MTVFVVGIGRAPASVSGGHAFDLRPSHTKDFKQYDINGIHFLGVGGYPYGSLTVVRINGPEVLVTYPGNAVI